MFSKFSSMSSIFPDEEEFKIKNRSFKLPEGLSIKDFQPLNLSEKYIPNILLFLGLIHNITEFKRAVIKEVNPYAHINSVILSNFLFTLGNDSKKLLVALEKEKWIEVVHSYTVGKKSKGYRVGPKFKRKKWTALNWKNNLEDFLPSILIKSHIGRRKELFYSLWDRASIYFTTWQAMPDGDLKDMCRQTAMLGAKVRVDWSTNIEEVIYNCAVDHMAELVATNKLSPNWTLEDQIDNYKHTMSLFDGENFHTSAHDSLRFEKGTNRLFSNIVLCFCVIELIPMTSAIFIPWIMYRMKSMKNPFPVP